ncbi:MAG: AI-2E family transporter, partial [Novipirellula sp. JB048]
GPVVVLIAVAFWGFLWGLPGVFLSVPLLIVLRKVFASFEATYPLAVVLGEDACDPEEDCEPIQDDQPIAEAAPV